MNILESFGFLSKSVQQDIRAGNARILVCGGRDFKDYRELSLKLKVLDNALFKAFLAGISEIIEGGARGADTLAGEFADEYRIKRTTVKADWKKYGSTAGPIRNTKMLELKPEKAGLRNS